MRRISTATRVVDKFGAGKDGFTNGNPVGGIPATDLEDNWFDHVQEEIANVIESASLTLDGNDRTQLQAALVAKFAAIGGSAAQAFQVATASAAAHAINLGMFTGSNQSLLTNGYQKLPGGFILQWGQDTTATTGLIVTFPIAFPTTCRFAIPVDLENLAGSIRAGASSAMTSTTFGAAFTGAPNNFIWFAIGH